MQIKPVFNLPIFTKDGKPLHHLPFLVARGFCVALLEGCHVFFPLLLAGQCGQPGHGLIPLKVEWRVADHHQPRPGNIDLHL